MSLQTLEVLIAANGALRPQYDIDTCVNDSPQRITALNAANFMALNFNSIIVEKFGIAIVKIFYCRYFLK